MRKLVVLLFAVMIGFAAVPSTYAAPQGTIVAALRVFLQQWIRIQNQILLEQ